MTVKIILDNNSEREKDYKDYKRSFEGKNNNFRGRKYDSEKEEKVENKNKENGLNKISKIILGGNNLENWRKEQLEDTSLMKIIRKKEESLLGKKSLPKIYRPKFGCSGILFC